jgi:putative ABC transport system permease protein
MIRNYFTIALRNISKYKFHSAINILGMTIGVTACLLIILWVADELSYDRFHKDYDRIYQVGLHGKIGDQDIHTSTTCSPLAGALVAEAPEVESATRVIPYFGKPAIKYEDKVFAEDNVFYADSNFFAFFSFVLMEGDTRTALTEPNSIVLTEETAIKYFGSGTPLGKIVMLDGKATKVTGVARKAPSNSHLKYNALISAISNEQAQQPFWVNNWMFTYLKLQPGADVKSLEGKFASFVKKYVGPEIEKFMGMTMEQMGKQGGTYGYYTTALADIHLFSVSRDDVEPHGDIMHVYIFTAIGIFILIIACINFMNLSTARSAGRAKEVGLRKAMGSARSQMVFQFLSESMIYSAIAVVIAITACYALLPVFNTLVQKELDLQVLSNPLFISSVIALVLFVGIVAGSYPAFYLTSFNPVEVLKGKVRAGMKSKGVRSGLVVLQFGISILLIIFTVVVFQQISFMHEKNFGLDKQNVMILHNAGRLHDNSEAFRHALNQTSGIVKTSFTNNTFPGVNNTTVFQSAASEQDHIMSIYYADYDHLDVLRLQIVEGRDFSPEFPSDSSAVILNEAAIKEFGFANPIGEEIVLHDNKPVKLRIIGVVKNFNFESFRQQVRPIAIAFTGSSNNLLIRYSGNPKELLSSVENLWKIHAPNEPFEYAFMDEAFDQLFRTEQRMGRVFGIFSSLAVFIAALGLFALASFTAEQRTKEIGIRKALGATSFSIVMILSREFTLLVLVAFVPAAIAGWYIADNWLNGFAHRISVSPLVIIASGFAAILIAWLTVSYQAVRAASANPVTSLRYE